MGQTRTCGWVKPVKEITTLPSVKPVKEITTLPS
jgi:hypothetical protein